MEFDVPSGYVERTGHRLPCSVFGITLFSWLTALFCFIASIGMFHGCGFSNSRRPAALFVAWFPGWNIVFFSLQLSVPKGPCD